MKHKLKTTIAITLSAVLLIGVGIASYADSYTDNSAIYVYDEDTNPNGNIGLISYYNEASADTDTMKAYIDAGDTYFANQLTSCRVDVSKGKTLLKSALAYKGIILPDNPTYEQIAQGIRNIPAQNTSGTMTITAHFHLDGNGVNKTFTDTATQTAWQQYNAYLSSHNTGESYSSQSGCYTQHYNIEKRCRYFVAEWDHLRGSGHSGYIHPASWNAQWCSNCEWDTYHLTRYEYHESCGRGGSSSMGRCNACSDQDSATPGWMTHVYGYDSGYKATCGKTNGQILKIDVTY